MGNKKYKWKRGETPPSIDPHSKNKHSIYAGYLRRYIKKLTQDPRRPLFKLFIVDGFCGGGIYIDENQEEHLGSPFIAFRAVKEALTIARESRTNPIDACLHYYFVDENKEAIEYLKNEHKKRGINHETNYPVQYFKEKFELAYRDIINDIKQHAPRTQRVLFILDQYGWANVPFTVINDIFTQLSDAEIILTFSPDDIIDRAAAHEKGIDSIIKGLKRTGIDITPNEIIDIMRSDMHPDKWISRLAAQQILAEEIRNKKFSKYFTRYQIKSSNNHRSLMLIHLCQHPTAHNEMMEEHWDNSNIYLNHQGHVGISAILLGYDYKYENQLFTEDDFFETGENAVVNEMMQQIPLIIDSHKKSLSFSILMNIVINDSPVTQNIMRKVINKLIQHKQVEVIDHKTGKSKRRCESGLNLKDQIRLPQQRTFFT